MSLPSVMALFFRSVGHQISSVLASPVFINVESHCSNSAGNHGVSIGVFYWCV